jgi:hypothetical protein
MSYRANKPFGRRKTDLSTSARESSHWQQIRRDVEEDSSGLIRRYLRLSEKIVGSENEVKISQVDRQPVNRQPEEVPDKGQQEQKDRAA